MKLVSLNIWGGKVHEPLLDFIKNSSQNVDIFCLQEVYKCPVDKLIHRDMHSYIFNEISSLLPDHKGYFAPHLKQHDREKQVDFTLESGLGMFIRKSLMVKETGTFFVYRKGYGLLNDNYITIQRNLQYAVVQSNNTDYLVAHFHGVWHPRTKMDTPDRIKQSQKIKKFLSSRKEKKILCGDFNLLPNTKSMHILEEEFINLITKFGIKRTRSNLYKRKERFADYALVSPDIKVRKFAVLDVTVSDHLPLLLEFEN